MKNVLTGVFEYVTSMLQLPNRKENIMTTIDELKHYVSNKMLVKELITEIYACDNEPITALGVPQRGISMLNMFERGQVDFEYIKNLHSQIMKVTKS